jgi:hypothetical protein
MSPPRALLPGTNKASPRSPLRPTLLQVRC